MLCALDFLTGQPKEIVLAGKSDEFNDILREIRQTLIPNKVVAFSPDEQDTLTKIMPMLEDKSPLNNKPTVYVCQNHICKRPVNDVEPLKKLLA